MGHAAILAQFFDLHLVRDEQQNDWNATSAEEHQHLEHTGSPRCIRLLLNHHGRVQKGCKNAHADKTPWQTDDRCVPVGLVTDHVVAGEEGITCAKRRRGARDLLMNPIRVRGDDEARKADQDQPSSHPSAWGSEGRPYLEHGLSNFPPTGRVRRNPSRRGRDSTARMTFCIHASTTARAATASPASA